MGAFARGTAMIRTVTTVIDSELCIGCGKCIPVCPTGILEMKDGVAIVSGTESLQCGHCVAVCPVDAVRVDAIDPGMQSFATFKMAREWMPYGRFDTAELVRLMASRRSCRNFKPDPVPREVLEDLVKIACTAPSGTNEQPWTYPVLADRESVLALGKRVMAFFQRLVSLSSRPLLRNALRLVGQPELHAFHRDYSQKVSEAIEEFSKNGRDRMFHGAPAVILVCSRNGVSTPADDALLATQNMLLAAHAMGFGTCLIGFAVAALSRDRSIKASLGLARNEKVHAVIALGRPDETWHTVAGRRTAAPRFIDAKMING